MMFRTRTTWRRWLIRVFLNAELAVGLHAIRSRLQNHSAIVNCATSATGFLPFLIDHEDQLTTDPLVLT